MKNTLFLLCLLLLSCNQKKDRKIDLEKIDLEKIDFKDIEQYFDKSKSIRLVYINDYSNQNAIKFEFNLSKPEISDENLHLAIINSLIFQKRLKFSEYKKDVVFRINNSEYLFNTSQIKSVLKLKPSYWEMHEKSLLDFSDITLFVFNEGISKLSNTNDNILTLNYFSLLEQFSNEKVELVRDGKESKILLNGSSYTFYEFYKLSQYMSDEEFDVIEKLILDIWLIKYGDSLTSMIAKEKNFIYIKYDEKYLLNSSI
jgi:hypothetical protein